MVCKAVQSCGISTPVMSISVQPGPVLSTCLPQARLLHSFLLCPFVLDVLLPTALGPWAQLSASEMLLPRLFLS